MSFPEPFSDDQRELIYVFFDDLKMGNHGLLYFSDFFREHMRKTPSSEDWSFLGYLIATEPGKSRELQLKQNEKAFLVQVAYRHFLPVEKFAGILFDNLECHPYYFFGHVDTSMVDPYQGEEAHKDSLKKIIEHLLNGKMVIKVTTPSDAYKYGQNIENYEIVEMANIRDDALSNEVDEYYKLYNNVLGDHLIEVGIFVDVDATESGEEVLEDEGWDTHLLRLSEDWADGQFYDYYIDYMEEFAPHIVFRKPVSAEEKSV